MTVRCAKARLVLSMSDRSSSQGSCKIAEEEMAPSLSSILRRSTPNLMVGEMRALSGGVAVLETRRRP